MITLLHGDDIEASRTELNRLKGAQKNREIRQLDGKGLDKTALTQALSSQSLFGGEAFIIIENLFAKIGKKTKLIEELCEILVDSAKNADIVLWEEKEVGVTVTKNLGNSVQVRVFKIPTILFKFLDAIKPCNSKILLTLYQELVLTQAPESVFTMIVRRFRQLIQCRDNVIPSGLQGWQADRLTSQAKYFTIDILLVMYKRLLNIEYSLKSGATPFSLSQLTEQLLVDL